MLHEAGAGSSGARSSSGPRSDSGLDRRNTTLHVSWATVRGLALHAACAEAIESKDAKPKALRRLTKMSVMLPKTESAASRSSSSLLRRLLMYTLHDAGVGNSFSAIRLAIFCDCFDVLWFDVV